MSESQVVALIGWSIVTMLLGGVVGYRTGQLDERDTSRTK